MKKEYDFSKMTGRPNPYAKRLKKAVTIRLGLDVIGHFKGMAEQTGIPYQNLINLYLRDCIRSQRMVDVRWSEEPSTKLPAPEGAKKRKRPAA